jgi:hypothetical protein
MSLQDARNQLRHGKMAPRFGKAAKTAMRQQNPEVQHERNQKRFNTGKLALIRIFSKNF